MRFRSWFREREQYRLDLDSFNDVFLRMHGASTQMERQALRVKWSARWV